jgi:hypothetical protein
MKAGGASDPIRRDFTPDALVALDLFTAPLDPTRLPVAIAQALPARHSRSAPECLQEHPPGNAAAKDEDDAGEAGAVRDQKHAAAHLLDVVLDVVVESARTARQDPTTDL